MPDASCDIRDFGTSIILLSLSLIHRSDIQTFSTIFSYQNCVSHRFHRGVSTCVQAYFLVSISIVGPMVGSKGSGAATRRGGARPNSGPKTKAYKRKEKAKAERNLQRFKLMFANQRQARKGGVASSNVHQGPMGNKGDVQASAPVRPLFLMSDGARWSPEYAADLHRYFESTTCGKW